METLYEVEKPKEVANLLNTLLADEYVIFTKTKNVHGSIVGKNLTKIPEFFETHFDTLFKIIDDVEDRVKMLGHGVIGSFKDFISFTHFNKKTVDFTDDKEMIQTLINDHETVIGIIENELNPVFSLKHNDPGTTDFANCIMEEHKQMATMLKSYLA